MTTRTCGTCGGTFTPKATHPGQKSCSSVCRQEARKTYKRRYDRAWRQHHPAYMREYGTAYRALESGGDGAGAA